MKRFLAAALTALLLLSGCGAKPAPALAAPAPAVSAPTEPEPVRSVPEPTPEELAAAQIDDLLSLTGWFFLCHFTTILY